jgi:hypothetical protein
VLASHPPSGKTSPPFAPHHGVDHNTVAQNISIGNGVQIGGQGRACFPMARAADACQTT